MYALAGTPAANTYPASYLYAHSSDLTHVTSGSDGTCEASRQYLCNAAHSLGDGYTCANSSDDVYAASLWYLTAYGQIENAQAQKCLAIPSNSTANSTRLELEDCYGEPGEIWAAS